MAKKRNKWPKVSGHVSCACAAWQDITLPLGWDRQQRLSEFQIHVLVLRAFEAGYKYGQRKRTKK